MRTNSRSCFILSLLAPTGSKSLQVLREFPWSDRLRSFGIYLSRYVKCIPERLLFAKDSV
jgi:hypothetical protein